MLQPPIWVVFVFMLDYQPHPLHPLPMFKAGGDDVDAGRIDVAVAENVRQLGDVLFDPVEHPCEQVAEIVGKDFLRIYSCFFA